LAGIVGQRGEFYENVRSGLQSDFLSLSPKIHQEQLGKAYLENDIWFI
jgi:hypothetical protein